MHYYYIILYSTPAYNVSADNRPFVDRVDMISGGFSNLSESLSFLIFKNIYSFIHHIMYVYI